MLNTEFDGFELVFVEDLIILFLVLPRLEEEEEEEELL